MINHPDRMIRFAEFMIVLGASGVILAYLACVRHFLRRADKP